MIKYFYLTHRWDPNKYYTTPGQSGPGSNDNEGVFHMPQNSKTIRWFNVISSILIEEEGGLTSLHRCSWHVQPQP